MPKNIENNKIKVLEIYNENGETVTKLMQEWINEKYFFWNLKTDTSEIKYNRINK